MAHDFLPDDRTRETPIKLQKGRPMLPSGPIYHLVQTYDKKEWTTIGIRLRTWLTLTHQATQAGLLTHLRSEEYPYQRISTNNCATHFNGLRHSNNAHNWHINVLINDQLNPESFIKCEETLHTHLTKCKLTYPRSDMITCKTRGQTLVLRKVSKSRKPPQLHPSICPRRGLSSWDNIWQFDTLNICNEFPQAVSDLIPWTESL